MNKIADKIKNKRIKKNMTTKELARKCGLSKGYIEDVESGKKIINESIAKKIFEVLNINNSTLSQGIINEKKIVKTVIKKEPVQHKKININPSWEGAFNNIYREYKIYGSSTHNEIGVKKVLTLDKTVDGYKCDKIYFIVAEESLLRNNIEKEDILTIFNMKEIINDKIYYIKYKNSKFLAKIRKEKQKIVIKTDEKVISVDIKEVDILGRVVKIERIL